MPSENLFQQHKQIIVPRSHDHLLRRAVHSAGGMKIPGNGPAQGAVPLGLSKGKHLAVGIHQNIFGYFFPGGKGKVLQAYGMRGKVVLYKSLLWKLLFPGWKTRLLPLLSGSRRHFAPPLKKSASVNIQKSL